MLIILLKSSLRWFYKYNSLINIHLLSELMLTIWFVYRLKLEFLLYYYLWTYLFFTENALFAKFCRKSFSLLLNITQLTFTCSISTVETLEKGVKHAKINNKNTRTTSVTLFWCFYCKLWTYFTPFSSDSIVVLEQVKVIWEESEWW